MIREHMLESTVTNLQHLHWLITRKNAVIQSKDIAIGSLGNAAARR